MGRADSAQEGAIASVQGLSQLIEEETEGGELARDTNSYART